MTKRTRVSESAGSSALESKALRLGVSRAARTNLAPNPTCSVNLAGWVGSAGTGGSGTSARVATGGAVAPSFHRTTLSLCPNPPTSGTTIGSTTAGANAIPVSPGAVSISAYVRTVTLDRTAQMTATFYNAAGSPLGSAQSAVVNTWLGWARMVVETVVPAAAARVTVRIAPVDSGPYSVGSTFDTGSLLVEAATPVDLYFDGTMVPPGSAGVSWTGTAGASTSVATYPANLLPGGPDATANPTAFPPGLSAWRVLPAIGFPVAGMLLVHTANIPTDSFSLGLCYQQLFPDNDLTTADPMPAMTRTWSDQYGWNPWTSGGLAVYDEATLIEDLTGRMYFTGAGVGVSQVAGDGTVTVNVPGTMGLAFYPDPTDASDIATYKKLRLTPSTAAESTLVTACTGTGDVLVASFASDPGTPGAVDFPAGRATRNIYASVSAGTARFHLQVYKRDAAGVETLVRDEFSPNFTDLTATLQMWNTTTSAAGTLLATDRLVMKLYAQRVAGSTTINVTTYFEGSLHTSSITTTIAAGAPIGTAGGDLTGTYPNPTLAPAAIAALMVDVAGEGATVQADAGRINFVGAGVTAVADGSGGATVTVPGGSGGSASGGVGSVLARVASAALTAPTATTATSVTYVDSGLTVTFAAVAGHTYRVTVVHHTRNNTAATRMVVAVQEGAVDLFASVLQQPATSATRETREFAFDITPTAGVHTYKVAFNVAGGTGTTTFDAGVTYPASLVVDDLNAGIGLAPDPGVGVTYDGTATIASTASTAFVGVASGASGDFIVPRSGKVMIGISGYLKSSVAGQYSHLVWQFMTSGPGVISPTTNEALSTQDTGYTKATMWTLVTGLTPGAVHTVRAAISSGLATNTASVANTRIVVIPVDSAPSAAGAGVVGYAEMTSGTAGNATTTPANVPALTCTVTMSATRRYRVSVQTSVQSTVINDRVGVWVTDGVTQIFVNATTTAPVVSTSENFHGDRIMVGPTSGSHTFQVAVARASGATGTVSLAASTTTPSYLMVEDIGPV